jgi:microcystin-dependent protein
MDLRNNLLFNKNEAKDMVLHKSTTAPSSPVEGQTYFNTTDHKQYTYNGTIWESGGGGGVTSSDNSATDIQTLTKAEYDALTPVQKANKMWMTTDEVDNSMPADTVPIGAGMWFPSDSIPDTWLLCNGQAISRTIYSLLFAVLGVSHGAGDGSTTFNVPNIKGRVIVGKDSSDTDFDTIGETRGEKTHVLTISEMPNHNHSGLYIDGTELNVWNGTAGKYSVVNGGVGNNASIIVTGQRGSDAAHNNIQPSIVENYIIKAKYFDGVLPREGLVVDALTSISTVNALSANQGNILRTKSSRAVIDYTIPTDTTAVTISGLDLLADGGVYDVIITGNTDNANARYIYGRMNNISTASYSHKFIQIDTVLTSSFTTAKTECIIGVVHGVAQVANTSEFRLSLEQYTGSGNRSVNCSAEYAYSAIWEKSIDTFYNSTVFNLTSLYIYLAGADKMKAGTRIKIYKRGELI